MVIVLVDLAHLTGVAGYLRSIPVFLSLVETGERLALVISVTSMLSCGRYLNLIIVNS